MKISDDLRKALLRIKWMPVYTLTGVLTLALSEHTLVGFLWSLLFLYAAIGCCTGLALLAAMLFPIRGSYSLRERWEEIKKGTATF